MIDKPGQPKARGAVLSSLNMAIDGLNLLKEISSVTPAKAVFGSVVVLLTMIRVGFYSSTTRRSRLTHNQDLMANDAEYVGLGLYCAEICRALERGMDGKELNELSESVRDGINRLRT